MDNRHRVYYFANLNQNYRLHGWWHREYDDYGHYYEENIRKLKENISSLKIRPSFRSTYIDGYFQMKISCKKEEENILINTLQKLQRVNYAKIDPKTMEVVNMDAKKCDRCGAYYDKNEARLSGYEGNICGVSFVRIRHTGNVRYIAEKDLCDKCVDDFKRFLIRE